MSPHLNQRLQSSLTIFLFLLCLGTIIGFGGRYCWLFEVSGLFRVPYLIFSVILGIVLAFSGRPRGIVLCFLIVCINVFPLAPFIHRPFAATVQEAPFDGYTWKAMVSNVQEMEEASLEMTSYFQTEDPDFLLILEVDQPWLDAMPYLNESYPYHLLEPSWAGRGIAFYSKLPWDSITVWDVVGADRPALIASFCIDGHPLTIIGTHPHPPLSPQQWALRNEEITKIAYFIQQQPGSIILLGDLNVTPWSQTFQDVLVISGLEDGRTDFGHLPTWPAIGSIVWLPFDHILTTSDLTVSKLETGPNLGADHLPLIAEIKSIRVEVNNPHSCFLNNRFQDVQ